MGLCSFCVTSVRSSRLAVALAGAIVVGLSSANAESPVVRELHFQSLRGTQCILGHEITLKGARRAGITRARVEVKEGRGWRRARNQPKLRVRHANGVYRALYQMSQRKLFRYSLVTRRNEVVAVSKASKLSSLPLCPAVKDGDLVDQGAPRKDTPGNGGGLSSGSDTPVVPVCVDVPQLLAAWGASTGPCDLSGNGLVDGEDLGILLGSMK